MKKSRKITRTVLDTSRKTCRKQKRIKKKVKRREHYLKKNKKSTPLVNESGKFVKLMHHNNTKSQNNEPKVKPSSLDILMKEREKEKKEADKLKNEMEDVRKKMLEEANAEEEKIIKKLEKQLGLNKTKNKNNFFSEDGLDYLLEICDRSTTEQIVAAEKHLAEVDHESDFEEDLAVVTGKKVDKKHKKENIENDEMTKNSNDVKKKRTDSLESGSNVSSEGDEVEDDGELENDISDYDEISDEENQRKTKQKTNKVVPNKKQTEVFSDDEVSHLSSDHGESDLSNDDESRDSDDQDKSKIEKPEVWEDIYGRKRDKEGNIIKEEKGVYIPPHLREKAPSSEKDLIQLKRQVQSVLNKLAGTNLHWASTTIESLYANNSRHSVNSVLTNLWLEGTVCTTATPDRLVAEYAALISVLHANVGMEIGAHFIQELSKMFDGMMSAPQSVENKRLDNLVSCLAHLYSFKIFHSQLLYDILARFVDNLSEKSADCILVALRCVGGTMRKDDPAALKAFIQHTQSKVAEFGEKATDGSRIKFLLEVLMAVKNNNLTKIPNYEPTYVDQLKKATRSIIRKGNYVTPLKISLEDLLKADERGKWWVVGSAWEGTNLQPQEKSAKLMPSMDQKLLKLASQQRMNTDVRRSIFCIIMSAEDYLDAFEKLQHLGLKGQQEREVVHVLLACCLQEKQYNPYYAVLAGKLCDFDRKYQLSIQYSVWDKIKDLENASRLSSDNLAQFLTHLIMDKALPLSILKVIQFSDLNKTTVKFMRRILLSIIMNVDLQSCLEVFHRICKSPKLHMFRESIKLFIQHFLIRNASKSARALSDEDMAVLRERTAQVEKILATHDSKLRL